MENRQTEQPAEERGFFQALREMPQAMHQRFMKQILAAFLMAALTTAIMLYTKQIRYCWGYLFTVYLAYLGMSLVWQFEKQEIVCKTMVCVKATKVIGQRIMLILRELDAPELSAAATHQFYIPATKRDLNLITVNTIMEVYYNPKSPVEITAWEIVGMTGATEVKK